MNQYKYTLNSAPVQNNDFLSREIVLNQQKIIAKSSAQMDAVSPHTCIDGYIDGYGFVLDL